MGLRGPACVRLPEQGLVPPSTRNGEAGGGVTIFLISLVNPPGLAGVGTWRMLSGITRVTVFIYYHCQMFSCFLCVLAFVALCSHLGQNKDLLGRNSLRRFCSFSGTFVVLKISGASESP